MTAAQKVETYKAFLVLMDNRLTMLVYEEIEMPYPRLYCCEILHQLRARSGRVSYRVWSVNGLFPRTSLSERSKRLTCKMNQQVKVLV